MDTPGTTGQRSGPAAALGSPSCSPDPRARTDLYTAIQEDGQQLALALIQFLHNSADHAQLNPTDFQCLLLLRLGGPLSPGEISQRLRLASGSVTVVIDRLEARGLACRARHPEDRRKVVVQASDEARTQAGAGTGMREAMVALHERYSEQELEVISEWLHQLSTTLLDVASSQRT